MRLIDADLLEEQFGISDADILAIDEIRHAPTVDAVVVTRCKDCKHRIYKHVNDWIGQIGGCGIFDYPMPDDFFCPYGERKDRDDADR